MIYLGYIFFSITILFALIALVNLISNLYLPKKTQLKSYPLVSILIPARNEQQNIGILLDDTLKLNYPNYEVIVYDDQSTDRTPEIVEKKMVSTYKIQLIHGGVLEKGWLGKNYACHFLAAKASGDYYLFLDADVRINTTVIEKALTLMQKHHLGLLSVFPKQILDNRGAWYTVPLMNWILLSLLPLILVRISGWISFSAANGQFMCFDAEIYKKLQPHLENKTCKVEDMAICQYYKRQKVRVSTFLGDDNIRCKMYACLDDAINGFSKNIFAFFGNSLFATLLFAVFTLCAPVIVIYSLGIPYFLIYLCIVLLKKIIISKTSNQPIGLNLLYYPIQYFMFLKIITIAIKNRNALTWKGRPID